MKLFTSLIVLLLNQVSAWVIDHDLPDGVYRIQPPKPNDAEGKHIVKRVADISSPEMMHRQHSKRGIYVGIRPNKLVDGVVLPKDMGETPVPLSERVCHPREYFGYEPPPRLDPDDHWASKQALFNWCDMWHSISDHIEMALHGSVAVYACNNGLLLTCSRKEYEEVELVLNETCGEDKPGFGYIQDWAKEYGRATRGMDVCGEWSKLKWVSDHEKMYDDEQLEVLPMLNLYRGQSPQPEAMEMDGVDE